MPTAAKEAQLPITLPIEDWDNEPAVRLPADVLQRLDLQVGDSLYLVEAWSCRRHR
ncbi:hypothetical protein D3C81_1151200 [compost metagenome]|jgi:hypothetical protein